MGRDRFVYFSTLIPVPCVGACRAGGGTLSQMFLACAFSGSVGLSRRTRDRGVSLNWQLLSHS